MQPNASAIAWADCIPELGYRLLHLVDDQSMGELNIQLLKNACLLPCLAFHTSNLMPKHSFCLHTSYQESLVCLVQGIWILQSEGSHRTFLEDYQAKFLGPSICRIVDQSHSLQERGDLRQLFHPLCNQSPIYLPLYHKHYLEVTLAPYTIW